MAFAAGRQEGLFFDAFDAGISELYAFHDLFSNAVRILYIGEFDERTQQKGITVLSVCVCVFACERVCVGVGSLFVCMCGLSEKIRTTTTMREKSQPSERPFYYTVYLYFTTGSSWRGLDSKVSCDAWFNPRVVAPFDALNPRTPIFCMLPRFCDAWFLQEWLRLLTP
jgi:hypothetical protein